MSWDTTVMDLRGEFGLGDPLSCYTGRDECCVAGRICRAPEVATECPGISTDS